MELPFLRMVVENLVVVNPLGMLAAAETTWQRVIEPRLHVPKGPKFIARE